MAETNINWDAGTIWYECRDIVKRYCPNVAMATANSSEWNNGVYQPGGTCTVITGNLVGRVIERGQDPRGLGRFLYITLSGSSEGNNLTIITAYRVCAGINGPLTAAMQQFIKLRELNFKNPDPRKELLSDLGNFIQEKYSNGNAVVLMIDANESMRSRNSMISRFASNNGLSDAHQFCHPELQPIPTYAGGSEKIDYIFISKEVEQCIRGAGVEPFYTDRLSDHRRLFIDIDMAAIFKGEVSHISDYASRGIYSDDSRICRALRDRASAHFQQNNILERINRIAGKDEITPEDRATIEGIDREISNGLLSAAKHTKKSARIPWSPALMKAKKTVTFWELWRAQLLRGISTSERRNRLGVDVTTPIPVSLESINTNLRKAQRNLRDTVAKGWQIRFEYLSAKAEAEAKLGRNNKATIIKRILRAEESKQRFCTIQRKLKRKFRSGLHSVTIPSESGPAGEYKRIVDRQEIEETLLTHNQQHFEQAIGSPFSSEPLISLLGWDGSEHESNRVLQTGTIDADNLNKATKEILGLIKRPKECEDIDIAITTADLGSGFKSWKETTSTSPSGLHLGIYKSIFRHVEKKEDEPTISNHEYLSETLAKLLTCVIKSGVPLNHWKTTHTVMLEKEPGNNKIEKMRRIHIVEADYNLAVGIINRRIRWNAEKLGNLSNNQWGSRSGRSCTDVVMMKVLSLEIAHLTRTDLVIEDQDASAAYDRQQPMLVALACRKNGAPTNFAKLQVAAWKKAQFHVKTGLGISKGYYEHTEHHPLCGTLQGGKGSPDYWSYTSSLALEALDKRVSGATLIDPYRTTWLRRSANAFVDDTTLIANYFEENICQQKELDEVIRESNQLNKTWEDILSTVGGKLNYDKCLAYILRWEFAESGQPSLMTKHEIESHVGDHPIKFINSQGAEVKIHHKDISEWHRTLGIRVQPDLERHAEIQRLTEKSDMFAAKFGVARLTKPEATTAWRSIVIPSMTYAIDTIALSSNKWQSIQAPLVSKAAAACGFNCNSPRAVIHAPRNCGGCGMQDLFSIQGAATTISIIAHMRHGGDAGKIIQIHLQWFQLFLGTGQLCVSNPSQQMGYVPGRWVRTLQ